ncbi:hypothetical protein ACHAXT_003177 [Thalassiosira profunda]
MAESAAAAAATLGPTPSQVPGAGRGPRRRRGGRGKGRGGRGGGDSNHPGGRAPGGEESKAAPQPGGDDGGSQSVANIDGSTNGESAKKGGGKRRPRRRGRRGSGMGDAADETGDSNNVNVGEGSREAGQSAAKDAASSKPQQPQQKKQPQKQQSAADADKKKKKRSRNRTRQKAKKRQPWHDHIPAGEMDPISLDKLEDLPYPPFAICKEPPYVPIYPGMWPPPPPTLLTSDGDVGVAADAEGPAQAATNGGGGKDREMEILKQQWGEGVAVQGNEEGTSDDAEATSHNLQGRHFNLFDGRVLAFYLVSRLDFIDPNNRRNLTRPELQALDAYLAHHNLGSAGVVEAYDDRGVSISRASDEAQTSTGRAQMLQEEATAILGSFFQGGGGPGQAQPSRQQQQRERRNVRRVRSMETLREEEQQTNAFQRMYAEQNNRGNRRVLQRPQAEPGSQDTGIYGGDEGGFVMIDDDINPGLRSGMPTTNGNAAPEPSTHSAVGTFYSARHIAEQHSQVAQAREGNFPSLRSAEASSAAPTGSKDKAKPKPAGPAPKSLSKISNLVKKTDPKEVEKQRKAREAAQKRAEMSQMRFFDPEAGPVTANGVSSLPTAPAAAQPPSEGMIERNRNLAHALGVTPSTVRNAPALTGWARPVSATAAKDEFGNELSAAQYPDALLSQAKERMTELLKLEKKWKQFLADDRSPSCSLKAMERPLRKFVHEYSDFWRLTTESFDPESRGRKYIQCRKQADTGAPYPMLSEAARSWRGPTAGPSVGTVDVTALPTGPSLKPASTETSSDWRTEQRVPLKLAPRTAAATGAPSVQPASTSGMTRSTSTPLLSMTGEVAPPPRFADLHEKVRPRLQLAPRSIPTWDELESRNISQEAWNAMSREEQEKVLEEVEEEEKRRRVQLEREKEKEEARIHRQENRAKKEKELMVKKQAILESAFASDDDSDASSGSDWFEEDLEEFSDE